MCFHLVHIVFRQLFLFAVNRQFIVLVILITLILLPMSQMLRYHTIVPYNICNPLFGSQFFFFYNHPRWLSGKESACQCRRQGRHGFNPLVRNIPWRRKWQPTPVFWWKISWTEEPTVHGVKKDSETE